MKRFEYVPQLPNLPEEVCAEVLHTVANVAPTMSMGNMLSTYTCPPLTFDFISNTCFPKRKFNRFLYSHPNGLNIQVQAIRSDLNIHADLMPKPVPALGLPAGGRMNVLYYIIQDGVTTLNRFHTYDEAEIVDELYVRPREWYRIASWEKHSVVNVTEPRISVSIAKTYSVERIAKFANRFGWEHVLKALE